MASKLSVDDSETRLQSQRAIFDIGFGCVTPMAVKCAVELGAFDAIHNHGRPMTAAQLAAAVALSPSKSPFLARLLRLLARSGFLSAGSDGGDTTYALTPPSLTLVVDGASHLVRALLDPATVTPWFHLSSWFRDDSPAPSAFHMVNGMKGYWDHLAHNPELNDWFNKGMTYDSAVVSSLIVERCREAFDGVETLVDVGGGAGEFARAVVEAFPQVKKCVVYDLAHVVGSLQSDNKVEFVGGNMFEYVPQADAVFLKSTLHSSDDDACLRILEQCKKAISVGRGDQKTGKVILVEIVVDYAAGKEGGSEFHHDLLFDVEMMAMAGGKERDEKEWRKLFSEAGFASCKITPLSHLCLIELSL